MKSASQAPQRRCGKRFSRLARPAIRTASSMTQLGDHALLVDAPRMMLGTRAGMLCVGVARDGAQALAVAMFLQPDVRLLDLGLSKLDGLAVVEALHRAAASVKVLVCTARLDPQSIRAALGFGAAGYLPKGENSDELPLPIRRSISADIAQLSVRRVPVAMAANKLTASEATVLQLVDFGAVSRRAVCRRRQLVAVSSHCEAPRKSQLYGPLLTVIAPKSLETVSAKTRISGSRHELPSSTAVPSSQASPSAALDESARVRCGHLQ